MLKFTVFFLKENVQYLNFIKTLFIATKITVINKSSFNCVKYFQLYHQMKILQVFLKVCKHLATPMNNQI